MDIASLVLLIFELVNTNTQFWKSLPLPVSGNIEMLEASAGLKDAAVKSILEETFADEQYKPLLTWLIHCLQINPKKRGSGEELFYGHFLFANKERTMGPARDHPPAEESERRHRATVA